MNAPKTEKLLVAVIALQSLTLLGLWTGQPRVAPAGAAIPDPGAQREAMVAEQKVTNEKLDRLITFLRDEPVKVKVDDRKR